jgi:tetratricopeptide (TPR) repeat protein
MAKDQKRAWSTRMRPLLLVGAALLLPMSIQGQSGNPSEAIALQQQGKLEEAAQAWVVVTQRNPEDAAAFASLGLVLAKQGKYAEAVPAYERALALNPSLPDIELDLGLAEFKQEHFQRAIPPFRAALTADPQNMQARTLLGLSYYAVKQFAESADSLTVALRADPQNVELGRALARSCLLAKKYSCALTTAHHILEQSPDSVAAHELNGEALDGLGRTSEAVVEFQKALQLAPQEPELNFGLGYLYWRKHEYDQAAKAFHSELSLDPKNAQAVLYLGDIAMKRGDLTAALPLLQQALELRNDLRLAYLDLGIVFIQQKRYPDAVAALRSAEKLDPTQSDAHYRLARLYRDMGNQSASEEEFEAVRQVQKHEQEGTDLAMKMAATAPPIKP